MPRDGLTYQWIPPRQLTFGLPAGDAECYRLERRREKIVVASGFWIGHTEVTQAGIHADHECRSLVATKARISGGAGRLDGRDDLLQPDRHAAAHGIGVEICRLQWNCGTPEGAAGIPTWYDPNSRDSTHPVATKLPNGYGLWDMLGNVWEWVPGHGKQPGEHRLKGGSFYNTSRDVRVSGRLSAPPDLRHRDIGFRCASSVWPERIFEGKRDAPMRTLLFAKLNQMAMRSRNEAANSGFACAGRPSRAFN